MQLSTIPRGPLPIAAALALFLQPLSAQGPTLTDLPVTKLEQLGGARPPATKSAPRPAAGDLDAPHLLSATFARPLPIREVLLLLIRDTPFSVVLDPSVQGTFSGELRNLTIRQALEAVLAPARLDYDVQRTVLRVFPRRPMTRLFQLDLLPVRRSWRSRSAGADGGVVSAVESDVFGGVDRGVAALLSPQGQHHVDRQAGLVQVTDFADRLDRVAVYLETVQLRATRQVRLDLKVLRVTRAGGAAGSDGGRPPVITTDPAELIAALQRSGVVDVVASPTLMTMNNEPAMVRLSDSALARATRGGAAEAPSLSLVVTPQISADGFVHLSIVPAFARREETISESDSIVRVRLGQTVMVPALPQGPPGLEEWLVMLTPAIVNSPPAVQSGDPSQAARLLPEARIE